MVASNTLLSALYGPSQKTLQALGAAALAAKEEAPIAPPTVESKTLRQQLLASRGFLIPSAAEKKIVMHSPEYYRACVIGGVLACGLTHTAVTPLDVVKCNMQTDPTKYTSIGRGFGIAVKEQGLGGLVRGWLPTLFGYSIQGAGKFGLYEYFKK
jgi:Mitochondrial carrier protein